MGVPGLYTWLKNKIRTIESYNERIDTLSYGVWLDFNGIIHDIRNRTELIIRESGSRNETRFLSIFEDMLFRYLTIEIIQKHKPRILGVMVDGIAPAAKVNEQRKRRYKNESNVSGWLIHYSSMSITPGTDFMFQIDLMLRKFFFNPWVYATKYDESFEPVEDMTIIYSSHLEPGEGEQKIMYQLRNNYPDGSHIVYGDDADILIMLSLLERDSLTVMHSDTGTKVAISIDQVRAVFGQLNINPRDFLIVVSLVGNDFIPGTPSIEIPDLDSIIELYSAVSKNDTIVTTKGEINHQLLFNYLVSLANTESVRLNYKAKDKYSSNALRSSLSDEGQFIPDIFRSFWYRRALGPTKFSDLNKEIRDYGKYLTPESLSLMISNYFYGLSWILDYYFGRTVSQEWYYPNNYAPLLTEIVTVEYDPLVFNDSNYERTIFDNMLMVIPNKYKAIVPRPFMLLMNDVERSITHPLLGKVIIVSPVADLFPSSVSVDIDGVHLSQKQVEEKRSMRSMGIPILPPLDIIRIRSAVIACIAQKIKGDNALSEAEKMYNSLTHNRVGHYSYYLDFETRTSKSQSNFKHPPFDFNLQLSTGKKGKNISNYFMDYTRIYYYLPSESYVRLIHMNPEQLRPLASVGDYSSLQQKNMRKHRKQPTKARTLGIGEMGLFYPVEYKHIAEKRKLPSKSGITKINSVNIQLPKTKIDWVLVK